MNAPDDCTTLSKVRSEIDRIDYQIVLLLGERLRYVKAASRFKTSETGVQAPERLQKMLKQRREWAIESGLNADFIEDLYRDLVNHFIESELKHWRSTRQP